MSDEEEDVTDSLGIPGWQKVNALANALMDTSGLCISSSKAKEIQKLYNDLTDFDKKPLVFKQKSLPSQPRGRFGKSKSYRQGSLTVDYTKR